MFTFVAIFALAALPLGFGIFPNHCPEIGCSVGPLNNPEKQFILGIVNDISQVIAFGQLGDLPSAANLPEVIWDDNLERIAQREADTCEFRVSICPNSPNAPYGFMIGQYRSVCPYAVRSTYALSTVLTEWIQEYQNLDPRNVCNFQCCSAPNFSQLITQGGFYLGCGRVYDFDGQFHTMNLICAMNTAGNIIGQPMYIVGAPCSQCPLGTRCSRDYPGLCAIIDC